MDSKLLGLCSMILAASLVSARTEYGLQLKTNLVELNFLQEKTYPNLTSIVRTGGYRAMEECRKLFKNEIWNCTVDNRHMIKELPSFVKATIPYATREIAFIHAISTAAIINEIALQCQRNRIPGCGCDGKKQQNVKDEWEWGGCGDNIRFGEKETRRFVNVLKNGNNAERKAFHFHNTEVGRKVVRLSLKKVCKCHGLSGSCTAKICWRQLVPFEVIGEKLKLKYRNALRVWYKNNKLQERGKNKLTAKKREKKLVYLDPSPNYCVPNKTLGSPGLLGRICRSDDVTTKKCRSLCNSCKLKHHTIEMVKQVKCRCRFVWCCSVKCDTCTNKYSATTCIS